MNEISLETLLNTNTKKEVHNKMTDEEYLIILNEILKTVDLATDHQRAAIRRSIEALEVKTCEGCYYRDCCMGDEYPCNECMRRYRDNFISEEDYENEDYA